MPSVLHICTDFWPSTGGIEQFVLELAKRSSSVGIPASVLSFNRIKGHKETLPKTDMVENIPVTRVPFIDLRFYKPTLLPLRLLKAHDLLHVHGIGAPLDYAVLTKLIHRKPIVMSTHGGIFHTTALLPIKRMYFYGFARLTMRGVDCVAACSRSDETLFRRISQRVVLLENAVDVADLLRLPLESKVAGRCLYVGRLSANKQIPSLLNVFADAKRGGAQFSLRLAGPDQDGIAHDLNAMANALGIEAEVLILGELDQSALMDEFQRAENFVSASRYEGFGLSAVEAKAAGCRLILHRNEAFVGLFGDDPTAALVDFTNTPAAASILTQTLAKRPEQATLEKRQDVLRFSWEQKILDWKDLYFQHFGAS